MPVSYRTLFSGGELFGCGARAAGWAHVDGYEWDPKIAAVANRNGFRVHTADVRAVDYAALRAVDHLHMSPVCKRASVANTDAEESPEDLETAEACIRAIRAHTGRSASLENVWPYRNFESFKRIEAALWAEGFAVEVDHLNAADFGVPQTRKRLILRAVRRSWRERVPTIHPTHREGGDMFHAPWVGWYEAIEDLIPELPETRPAAWQLKRLPAEIAGGLLVDCMFTGGKDAEGLRAPLTRRPEEPAPTVTASPNDSGGMRRPVRALLVHPTDMRSMTTREANEPAFPLRAGSFASSHRPDIRPRALLMGDQAAAAGAGIQLIGPDDPAFTVRAISERGGSPPRAMVSAGRWVKLTVRALGRFQTVPDDYQGLTAEINGNGVPCLLARRICESFGYEGGSHA